MTTDLSIHPVEGALVPTPRMERLRELLSTRPLDSRVRCEAIDVIVVECQEVLKKGPPRWPGLSPVPVWMALIVVLLTFEDGQ